MPIMSPRNPGWTASRNELLEMLDLPKRLPPEGRMHDIWSRQGYFVRLLPQGRKTKGRRMEHRLQVQCNECREWFSAGRLAQHEASCGRQS
jgi:hypothetical protein